MALKNKPFFAFFFCAFCPVGLFFFLVLAFGYPEPYIHDEFAYLLGADTFLEGRLTNPTPPQAEFFETFHVSMTPTYHSKYPPGQSAFLALGKLIFGREIYGVWLSYVLAAMAVTWALQVVLPSRWALLAGLLAVVNSHTLIRWAYSFWGGSVAMLGGALFMGGLLRVYKRPRWSAAAWISCGCVILSITRPLEGLITVGISLIIWLAVVSQKIRSTHQLRPYLKVFVLLGLTGLTIIAFNLFYNHLLTGSALTFPHFHWDPADSSHALIRSYTGSAPMSVDFRLMRFFSVFLGPTLCFSAFASLVRLRDPRVFSGWVTVLGLAVYSALTSRAWPHYFAPVVPMVIALIVCGGWLLCQWRIGKHRAGLMVFSVLLIFHMGLEVRALIRNTPRTIGFKQARQNGSMFKRDLDRRFRETPGHHLILIRYLEGHSLHNEYLYNRADIPAAQVIWARESTPEANARLYAAYPGRRLWRMTLRNRPVEIKELGTTDNPGALETP